MVESFSKRLLASRIFDTYVAFVFFMSLIFFVLNAAFFTPFEMILGVVVMTTAFKAVANIMISMTISLLNLDSQEERLNFEEASQKVESLVNDLAIKEAGVQSAKNN